MALEVLPQIGNKQITPVDIYEEYVNKFKKREFEKLNEDNGNYKGKI